MTTDNAWLVATHVVGGAVWLGTWMSIIAYAANTVRAPAEDAIRRLFMVMRRLGPAMIGPSTVLVLGAGIGLVVRYDRVDWADLSIVLALAIYVLATVVGVAVLARHARNGQKALADGDIRRAVCHTRSWLTGADAPMHGISIAVLLLLATEQMALRP